MKFIIDLIFRRLARSIDGYKLYILGAVPILKGLLGIIAIYWPDSGSAGIGDIDQCLNEIWAGCLIIGGKSAIVKVSNQSSLSATRKQPN